MVPASLDVSLDVDPDILADHLASSADLLQVLNIGSPADQEVAGNGLDVIVETSLNRVGETSQTPSDQQVAQSGSEIAAGHLFGSSLGTSRDHIVADGTAEITHHSSSTIPQPSPDRVSSNGSMNEDNLRRYRPLYLAILAGDWDIAETIFKEDSEATTATISIHEETVLHVATLVGRTEFLRKLVERVPLQTLERQDSSGKTCLHNAAIYGSLDEVEILVGTSPTLTQIMDEKGNTPLIDAAYYHNKDVTRYLASMTTDADPARPFTGPKAGVLISVLTYSGFYDICLDLLGKYPNLATAPDSAGNGMLSALADKPLDFPSGSELKFWERCIYHLVIPEKLDHSQVHSFRRDVEDPSVRTTRISPTSRTYLSRALKSIRKASWRALEYAGFAVVKRIKDEKNKHICTVQLVEDACRMMSNNMTHAQIVLHFAFPSCVLHNAASNGVVEIINICLRYFPYVIWLESRVGYILHEAVRYRQEKVLNLMLKKNVITKLLANRRNQSQQTILHIVGNLAPYPQLSSVSCPALQMQRELQWFQVVEEFVHPLNRALTDNNQQTARELFTSDHKELLRDAERWMKDTSNSCMLVATLIATVVFAAAFTVPGGNIDGKGIPIFLEERIFIVFALFDALALFSSTTSILMFLSILTARYAEKDFLRALPKRLIFGFASLFAAIATLMVAFGATLYMVLSERFKWIFAPIIVITFIPIAVFVMLQLPLFIYMVKSTYGHGIFRPSKLW